MAKLIHSRAAIAALSLIFALTDWLVLPLRRLLPAVGRWDTASLIAAFLIELVQYALLWLIGGGGTSPAFMVLLALFGVVRLALSGLSVLVIVYAVLSWVQTHSPMMGLLARLVSYPRAWRNAVASASVVVPAARRAGRTGPARYAFRRPRRPAGAATSPGSWPPPCATRGGRKSCRPHLSPAGIPSAESLSAISGGSSAR